MLAPSYDLEYSHENPPETQEQARELITFLDRFAQESMANLMLSEMLYENQKLIFCITSSVEDASDDLLRAELKVLEKIKNQPRNTRSVMYLNARIGALYLYFGGDDVKYGRNCLNAALREAGVLRCEEVIAYCAKVYSREQEG